MMLSNLDAPARDEIEISVFGKGYGEAVVIHVGDSRWVVVDSISAQGRSLVKVYLEGLGVNIARNVEMVVATHWHDDHVSGMSDLFSTAERAELVFPTAMLQEEFVKFAAAFNHQKTARFSSGVEEFGRLIETANTRFYAQSKFPIKLVHSGTTFYRKLGKEFSHGQSVAFEALSPSHFDVASFVASVRDLRPEARVLQRAPLVGQNDISAAIWFTIAGEAVLLGADLENRGDHLSGWNAVLSSAPFPNGKARIVKVPHHGGKSGHQTRVWEELIDSSPIASLTPWTKGSGRLPSGDDIKRLSAITATAYSTGPSATGTSIRQPTIVEKVLSKDRITLRRVAEKVGQIRHRAKLGSSPLVWRTDLFGPACPLTEMAA